MYFFGIAVMIFFWGGSWSSQCKTEILGYRVLENAVYPFQVGKDKACFFAFYTVNPNPEIGSRGNGNKGDALWYGYYKVSKPSVIYEFTKPNDDFWDVICSINAISFRPMHGGKKRDVTIIGSCDKYNAINYTFPLVFVRHGDRFELDKQVYTGIYGFINLTVADVANYIKSPEIYFKIFEKNNEMHC